MKSLPLRAVKINNRSVELQMALMKPAWEFKRASQIQWEQNWAREEATRSSWLSQAQTPYYFMERKLHFFISNYYTILTIFK